MAGLKFELGADISKFDRAMNRAKEIVVKQTGDMLSTVQSASSGMESALAAVGGSGALGPGLRTAAGFLVTYKAAILTATAAIAAWGVAAAVAADQVEQLNTIANGVKQADVGAGFFQVWARAAEEAGLSTKEAADALTKARAAVTSKLDGYGDSQTNPIADLLGQTALGRGVAVQQYQDFINAPNTEGKIKAITEAIRELNREALRSGSQQMNPIGDKLAEMTFGDAKFAEPIRAAKDSMEALQVAASATGVIFSDDLVRRAKELDDRVQAVRREMSDGLAPIMHDLAVLGLDLKQGWVDIEGMIAGAARVAGTLYTAIKNIADLVPNLKLGERFAQMAIDAGLGDSPMTKLANQLKADQKAPGIFSNGSLAQRAAGLNPLDVNFPVPANFNAPANPPLPPVRPDPRTLANQEHLKASTPTAEDIDQVQRYLDHLTKSVAVLDAEAASLGKTRAERALAVEMARAEAAARERGTALTGEEIARTTELSAKKAQLNQVLADFAQKQQQMNELGGFVGNQLVDAFDSILTQGASVKQVLDSITSSLIKAALQAAILGQGPLAGLLGSSASAGSGSNLGGIIGALMGGGGSTPNFGGFYARGGTFSGGKPIIVGERGPELIYPRTGGTVVPNHMIGPAAVMGGGGGGGGGLVVNVHPPEGHTAQVQETQGPGGMRQLEIMVEAAVVKNIGKNGGIAQAIQGRYAVSRTAGRR